MTQLGRGFLQARLCMGCVLAWATFVQLHFSNPAVSSEACTRKGALAKQIQAQAKVKGHMAPVFKIERSPDGQALLYWDLGKASRSFYAITFRSDGCAILAKSGRPRRFIFPKSAYNTGVFEEMDRFDQAM